MIAMSSVSMVVAIGPIEVVKPRAMPGIAITTAAVSASAAVAATVI